MISPATPAQAQVSTSSSKPPHRSLRELADGLEGVMAAKFARSGFTSPFGKLGKQINGLTLPAEVEEKLRKRWAEQGSGSFLEFLRERIVIAEMGRDAVEDAHRARLDAIEGIQQE